MPTGYRVKMGAPLLRPGMEIETDPVSEHYVTNEVGKLLSMARESNATQQIVDKFAGVDTEIAEPWDGVEPLFRCPETTPADPLSEDGALRLVAIEARGLVEKIAADHGITDPTGFACPHAQGLYDALDLTQFHAALSNEDRKPSPTDVPVETSEPLEVQVERLAQHILANFPGEPSEDLGAIDTAIRLLTILRERLLSNTEIPERQDEPRERFDV